VLCTLRLEICGVYFEVFFLEKFQKIKISTRIFEHVLLTGFLFNPIIDAVVVAVAVVVVAKM